MTDSPQPPRREELREWSRPVPVRRDSQFRAWMYFLAGVFAVVALWSPLRAMYQRTRYMPAVVGERDSDSFIALAYGGVSARQGGRESQDVSREQFAAHIAALRQRGFNPIGLQDVRAFYKDGVRLPRKAVLLTLEQSKKSSYQEARDVLRRNRWKATMFVRADTIEHGDQDALRWPILKEMALSGTWDVAAESVRGFRRIPVGPDGATANFFAAPEWLAEAARLESVAEFKARIRGEHETMVRLFEGGVGSAPGAFAFPFGDYGQYDPRAVASRVLNLEAVASFYGIGFTLGPFMLNTRHSDPRVLNRLLVDPAWSMEQFIAIVESGQATAPWSVKAPLELSRWQTTWGGLARLADGTLRLHALGAAGVAAPAGEVSSGALTWMAGSDLFRDYTLRMRFRLGAGYFTLRMRSRIGGEAIVRLVMDSEGTCRVNQKVYGAEEQVLAEKQGLESIQGGFHDLQVTLRGRTMTVLLDERMVFGEPIYLLEDGEPGMFGLEVWDPQPGVAAVDIQALAFPRERQVLLQWGADDNRQTAALLSRLHGDACRLAGLSPPWVDIVRSIPLVMPRWDDGSVQAFARIHGVPILPRMRIQTASLAEQVPPEMPAREAAACGVDGVYINCDAMDSREIPALVPWLRNVHEKLKEHDMKLAISFPPAMADMASFASVAALFAGALVVVDHAAAADQLGGSVSNVVVSQTQGLPSAADMHLDLFYQLATKSLAQETESPRARQESLRKEGLLAYQQGEYAEAIRAWSAWLQEDPVNTDAMALLAEAHIRVGDREKALGFYKRCLAAAPGSVHLAVRQAALLDQLGREEESRQLLNLYARVFPENAEILIAQAQWLNRRGRRDAACAALAALVKEQPLNVSARVSLLGMQEQSAERYRTMRELLEMGRAEHSLLPFSQILQAEELLTYPESSVFFAPLRAWAGGGKDERQRARFEQFLPLTSRVTDRFSEGRLSDGWIASGGMRSLEGGRYELRTAIGESETYLRLRRSELLRDAVLEVSLDESQGFFWIYARRSSHAMVRFGFDAEGGIHLQAWHEGDLVSFRTRPWIRPPGSLTMRLMLRGDGAHGFVNGLEIFDNPLAVPPEVAYGWWGIAPFAFELGLAKARIAVTDCTPLSSALALVAPLEPTAAVRQLRPRARQLSAVCPAWVFQKADGTLPDRLPPDDDILRMFCAFHCLRLLPVIDLVYNAEIDPAVLLDFLAAHALTGAVLKQRVAPAAAWLEAMQRALEHRPATVLVLQTEAALWEVPAPEVGGGAAAAARPAARDALLPPDDQPIVLRELPVGSVLIPPLQDTWAVPLSRPEDGGASTNAAPVAPQLHLLGSAGAWLPAPQGKD